MPEIRPAAVKQPERSPGYEVVIVRYGTRRTVRSDVFLNYALYDEPDAPIEMDYFFWVIRDGERTVVVDTGFSEVGGAARKRTTLIDPRAAFTALGIDPADAPTVVVTHAHYDHIGNLDHFGASPIVIARAELDFWRGPHSSHRLFHHSVEDAELATLDAAVADGRVQPFEDHVTVAQGIDVIRVGGHTPGQAVVLVQTGDGPVLLASDAVHYYEECDRNMPFVSVANLPDMYAGFDRVRAMVADGQVRHVVAGHDPDTLGRFTPLAGPLAESAAVIGRSGS